ncbi:MAG TPA: hypothetical protein VFX92_06880 [Candidatus Krumholzibacteria bacterium]|nr:hypothetical protein [Candidatus Krumholzibacteria bacterium]
MILRRLACALVTLLVSLPLHAGATTAPSLSDRIVVDGLVGDYTTDEWILDATSSFPERGNDSRQGIDNDIARVAATWDGARLYIAVELALTAPHTVLVAIGGLAGGIPSLDGAGEFRRAIDLPFRPNLLALAEPGATPRVARADATHAFALVDRARVPAAIADNAPGKVGFEIAIPWDMLDAARPLRLLVAVSGGPGTGAADAAPDARGALASDPDARAVLDRWIEFTADADGDGNLDYGVSPRSAAVVLPGTDAVAASGDPDLDIDIDRKAFAPDRGETVRFTLRSPGNMFDEIEGTCVVCALDGRRIRTLAVPRGNALADVIVEWDGRDDTGRVCDGAVYVAAFEVRFSVSGVRAHISRRVGAAVVR